MEKEKRFPYVNKRAFWDETAYAYQELHQAVEIVLLALAGFFLPFLIGHPQELVGVLVNMFLIRCAMHSRFLNTLPVILLPSLGALTAGLLFGAQTKFLLYFIPFIWVANALLVLSYKYFTFEKKAGVLRTSLAVSFLKAGFLFLAAVVLVSFAGVPAAFLMAMGPMQLATALGGYYLAVGIDTLGVKGF